MDFKTANPKISWGITLIFFGILFLIKEIGVISSYSEIFNIKNYPLYAGVIFLLTKNFKISVVLFAIGLLLRLNQIIELTASLSNYIWPLLLIAAGVLLIVGKNISKK